MNRKMIGKILATMLVITLTFANIILLGTYASKTYASTNNLEKQGTNTNDSNVEFDAYFKDEKGQKIHTNKMDFKDESQKLYLHVSVKKGYLKNPTIQLFGDNNYQVPNFEILDSKENLELVQNIDVNNQTIILKQLNAGTEAIIELPIRTKQEDSFQLGSFIRENQIHFSGSYVSNEAKNIEVKKTTKLRLDLVAEANIEVEQGLQKLFPYQTENKRGLLLQTIVRTSLENNSLPIAQTNLEVMVPVIGTILPEKVIVTANSMKATNGKQEYEFTSQNWNYNEETGKVTIEVRNEAQENKVSWNKEEKDEYVITYLYKEEALNKVAFVEQATTSQTVKAQIIAYNSVDTKVEKTVTGNINLKETLGSNIETTITTNIHELGKGYLYTKSEKEINYEVDTVTDIAVAEFMDSIILENGVDKFLTENQEERITNLGDIITTYYKKLTIAKQNFEKILGTDGTLTIKNGETILGNITKETIADEKGNYVYEFTGNIAEIKIETSKPIEEGRLKINYTKAITGKSAYSKDEMKSFTKLQVNVRTQEDMLTKAGSVVSKTDIALLETSTQIEASINKQELSTVVKNENIEFRVVLKSNDLTCDLFKNPVVEIVLPSYVEEVELGEIKLLYEEELNISNAVVQNRSDGAKAIQITLVGETTKYNTDQLSMGANIVIPTNIIVKNLTPTKNEMAKIYVSNENVSTDERATSGRAYAELELKASAPTGMVTTNTITSYNSKNETVTSMNGQEQVGKLEVGKAARTAKVSMNVINNYEEKANNVSILGRIPFNENKNPADGVELGSNFTTALTSAIHVVSEKLPTIYYSTNAEATKDLNNSANGWVTTMPNASEVKSYLIVFENYNMPVGGSISFGYDIQIPENLSYNQSTYENYVVYFEMLQDGKSITNKEVARKVGLVTGEGPDLQVAIQASVTNGVEVEEGSNITYTIQVKNNGSTEQKNITVTSKIPEGSTETQDASLKEYKAMIGSLAPGESKELQYTVQVNYLIPNYDENGNENGVLTENIVAKGSAKVEGYEKEFTSEQWSNKIVEGWVNIKLSASPIPEEYIRNQGDEIGYFIQVANVNMKEKENMVVKAKLPEGTSFVEAGQKGVFDSTTNTITWNIGKLEAEQVVGITMKVKVDNLTSNTYERDIVNTVILTDGVKEKTSNQVKIKVNIAGLTVAQTSNTNTVAVGEMIEYHITVKNTGKAKATSAKITDELPKGLQYKGAKYTLNGKEYTSNVEKDGIVQISLATLGVGEQADITISALVTKELAEGQEISNKVKVSADNIAEIESNEIKHKISASTGTDDDPSTGGDVVEGTYRVAGVAWLDANGNGEREEQEEKLANIKVILINSENGSVVKDVTTGLEKIQTTSKNGSYTFANIPEGKYIVAFFYDTNQYSPTLYKKQGISEIRNSDAIAMKINYDGKIQNAAATDTLEITSANKNNIDLGLIVSPKFDLKLDKVITKITVQDSKESKVHNYEETKLAKLDINPKYINNTNIIIEYKIKVTNEGRIAGFAKKIVDYLPNDVKFSSELNPDWYETNGVVYNASLANTLINPGETKEIILLLTKKMNENNTGIINNNAEIYEASNELGMADVDSIPGNKVQGEDDLSAADALISLNTGENIMYIAITLTMIVILGVGMYLINKKVLRKIQ